MTMFGYPFASQNEFDQYLKDKHRVLAKIDPETGIDHGTGPVVREVMDTYDYSFPVVVQDLLSSAVTMKLKHLARVNRGI